MNPHTQVTFSWNLLRYSYGGVVLLAGLDKVFGTDIIVNWAMYISPLVSDLLPVSNSVFLLVIGLVEVAVAIMLLTKYTKLGAYLSVAWLLLISINLLMLGYVDIAIRDILLAVGALALAQLSEATETRASSSTVR